MLVVVKIFCCYLGSFGAFVPLNGRTSYFRATGQPVHDSSVRYLATEPWHSIIDLTNCHPCQYYLI